MTLVIIDRKLLFRNVTEHQFQRQVLAWAKRAGWTATAMQDSRSLFWGCEAGFPDLILIRGEQLLFVELKTESGRVTPRQATWHQRLRRIPCAEVHVWRPSMEQEIKRILQ